MLRRDQDTIREMWERASERSYLPEAVNDRDELRAWDPIRICDPMDDCGAVYLAGVYPQDPENKGTVPVGPNPIVSGMAKNFQRWRDEGLDIRMLVFSEIRNVALAVVLQPRAETEESAVYGSELKRLAGIMYNGRIYAKEALPHLLDSVVEEIKKCRHEGGNPERKVLIEDADYLLGRKKVEIRDGADESTVRMLRRISIDCDGKTDAVDSEVDSEGCLRISLRDKLRFLAYAIARIDHTAAEAKEIVDRKIAEAEEAVSAGAVGVEGDLSLSDMPAPSAKLPLDIVSVLGEHFYAKMDPRLIELLAEDHINPMVDPADPASPMIWQQIPEDQKSIPIPKRDREIAEVLRKWDCHGRESEGKEGAIADLEKLEWEKARKIVGYLKGHSVVS